ncbi:hypothetical protein GPJ56_003942 [Histomonas meleagridis]|uniref:uncharacterized protein n=1 Tax=Histomonas meleagridis TaxID=135588 RepID=UPI00355AB0CF|nr:hypothetical protein GPJ56_003942 [Histomonas meleagridis]KAH0800355.1 hypothetical protein GO595_006766 [Histomonas meleagridis]
MGLGRIFGGIRKFIQNAGRLVRKVIDKGKRIYGKVSPIISRGIEFGKKIPGIIDTVRKRKGDITDKIDKIVDAVPDGKIKDKIRQAVEKGKEVADRVIDTGQKISDKTQPWIQAGGKIYGQLTKPKYTGDVILGGRRYGAGQPRPAVMPYAPGDTKFAS